jgi:hypothetical protein
VLLATLRGAGHAELGDTVLLDVSLKRRSLAAASDMGPFTGGDVHGDASNYIWTGPDTVFNVWEAHALCSAAGAHLAVFVQGHDAKARDTLAALDTEVRRAGLVPADSAEA